MITIIINFVQVYLQLNAVLNCLAKASKKARSPFIPLHKFFFAFCLNPDRVECGLGKDIRLIGVYLIEVEMLQLLSHLVNKLHSWAQLESKKCFN